MFSATNLLLFYKTDLFKIGVAVVVLALILIIIRVIFRKKKEAQYYLKDALLTPTEIEYYDIIARAVAGKFFILPQINLASIIDKKGGGNFRSELFRNIDFGIFDADFKPLLLIEINDNTHFRKDRQERDEKVGKICKKAGIPLLTFWVKDGVNPEQITKKVQNALRRYY